MAKRTALIAPSILSADMANLQTAVEQVEAAGADWIHVDVMDGRFVPNITVGIPVVSSLRKRTRLPLDVHLMILEPERYLEDFIKAGASIVTVQAEATTHLHRTLRAIRDLGAKSGVALNPATPLQLVEHVLEETDLVLLMTVEPGFGGQSFIAAVLPKIRSLRKIIARHKLPVDIEVDGGINMKTIRRAAEAGANVFVSGTGVFGSKDVSQAIRDLRTEIRRPAG